MLLFPRSWAAVCYVRCVVVRKVTKAKIASKLRRFAVGYVVAVVLLHCVVIAAAHGTTTHQCVHGEVMKTAGSIPVPQAYEPRAESSHAVYTQSRFKNLRIKGFFNVPGSRWCTAVGPDVLRGQRLMHGRRYSNTRTSPTS